jgi:hypothetical protein
VKDVGEIQRRDRSIDHLPYPSHGHNGRSIPG